jgi:hypothetical protein
MTGEVVKRSAAPPLLQFGWTISHRDCHSLLVADKLRIVR